MKISIKEVKVNPNNPRIIRDEKFNKLVTSIKVFPQMLNLRPLVVDEDMVILGGNMRYRALVEAGIKEVEVTVAKGLTEEQKKEFIIKDNVGYGEWDWDMLSNEWDTVQLEEWGLDIPNGFGGDKDGDGTEHGKLTEQFIVPPFSVLDTRQGYWNDRKEVWRKLINDNGESREEKLSKGSMMSAINNGVSILDPVLAELVVRWFGLEKCNTFDCFAGDTVFGYVSSYLGNKFTGIELRKEQADLNNSRVKGFNAQYICDDGRNVLNHIGQGTQDLLFSCPPYYDLEVYSDLPNDASNQNSYAEFYSILDTAFSNAIKCLKDNRFAVITVGDVRDKDGYYCNFIDDIKRTFISNGMRLYNELILVEPIGTLPQRVGRFMEHRKIGKCHQNVLVFYKGKTKDIKGIYPKIKVNEGADAQL